METSSSQGKSIFFFPEALTHIVCQVEVAQGVLGVVHLRVGVRGIQTDIPVNIQPKAPPLQQLQLADRFLELWRGEHG